MQGWKRSPTIGFNRMHTKVAFLFFLVLFGAYAEHQAGKTVKRYKLRDKRLNPRDTTFHEYDTTRMKRTIKFSTFKMSTPRDLETSVVDKVYY